MENETNEHTASHPITRRKNPILQLPFVFGVAALVATLFTAWTPSGFVPGGISEKINQILAPIPIAASDSSEWPTPTPRPRPRIGIVAGHWGYSTEYGEDPGAVCPDGLTESEINLKIATLVRDDLVGRGFEVDLMQEFDPLLNQYHAMALVSIHADSCDYINDQATGFKVSAALATIHPDRAARLMACIRNRYASVTNLPYHSGSITADMSSYHAFDEIHTDTTAVIIETGFMNLDRQFLTQHPEIAAKGISDGIVCFIYNEDASSTGSP